MITNLDLLRQGDINVFGEFFRNNYPRMLKYCLLFIKKTEVAEDLVQETFVHFWEKRMSLDESKSAEALLFVSLRNRCLNYLRDNKEWKNKFELLNGDIEQLQFLTHLDYTWEEDLSMEERLIQELNFAIEKLPDKCRQILILSKFEGLKNRDVARKLGISVKAVEKQLAIARKKIADHLEVRYPMGLALFYLLF